MQRQGCTLDSHFEGLGFNAHPVAITFLFTLSAILGAVPPLQMLDSDLYARGAI